MGLLRAAIGSVKATVRRSHHSCSGEVLCWCASVARRMAQAVDLEVAPDVVGDRRAEMRCHILVSELTFRGDLTRKTLLSRWPLGSRSPSSWDYHMYGKLQYA